MEEQYQRTIVLKTNSMKTFTKFQKNKCERLHFWESCQLHVVNFIQDGSLHRYFWESCQLHVVNFIQDGHLHRYFWESCQLHVVNFIHDGPLHRYFPKMLSIYPSNLIFHKTAKSAQILKILGQYCYYP